MLSINCLRVHELKQQSMHIEAWCADDNSLLSIDVKEILNHFNIWSTDKFLFVRYRGTTDELKSALTFVNFPKRSYGELLVLKGNSSTGIDDWITIQEAFCDCFDSDDVNPLLGLSCKENDEPIEVIFVTKIFIGEDLHDKRVFCSLWDAVIDGLKIGDDVSFYQALKNLKWEIKENIIELDMTGMTGGSFLLSFRTAEVEKIIAEYTGKHYQVVIK